MSPVKIARILVFLMLNKLGIVSIVFVNIFYNYIFVNEIDSVCFDCVFLILKLESCSNLGGILIPLFGIT